MKIKEKSLVNIVFFLSLFPYIKLVPFIDAEIQPFASIFAAILLLLFRKKDNLKKHYSVYLFMVIAYVLVETCYVVLSNHPPLALLESVAIIFSPLLIFMALKDRLHLVSTKLFMISMTLWLVLGLFQKYLPSVLVATKIDFLLSNLISRWSAYDLSAISRGVVMFSPEPSYAAHNILFMLIFAIFLYKANRISQNMMRYCTLSFIVMIYLNLSSTLLFISILFLIPYGIAYSGKLRNWIILGVGVWLIFLIIPFIDNVSLRPVQVMLNMATQVIGGNVSINDIYHFESSYGSGRLRNTMFGYQQMFTNFGLGNGIGSWMRDFGYKPYSYISFVSSEMGVIGFLCINLIFLKLVLQRFKNERITTFAISCVVSAYFGLYFNSTTSLPLYWIIILIVYQERVTERELVKPNLAYERKLDVRIAQ